MIGTTSNGAELIFLCFWYLKESGDDTFELDKKQQQQKLILQQ